MNILAIETSCDETGIALLKITGGVRAPKAVVLDNFVASQIKIHQPFGGVVPNLAKREHLKNLPILFKQLQKKHAPLKFDLITVTVGPGLEPALWTGITFAQALAKEYKKPLVGANHLEGHLYSFLLSEVADARKIAFPAVALIVSGGHTLLLKMDSFTKWQRLGGTRDDAAGEAFDKVARMLKLNYPGGPEIEKLARKGDAAAIAFPRPMIHEKNYDFSFSGLKTSVLYYLRDHSDGAAGAANATNAANHADVAASFQQAAVDVLVSKTIRAARDAGAKSVILCGGVAANKKLRTELGKASHKIGARFFVPPFKYNLDNGAMIGLAGYMAHERKKRYKMVANGNLEI